MHYQEVANFYKSEKKGRTCAVSLQILFLCDLIQKGKQILHQTFFIMQHTNSSCLFKKILQQQAHVKQQ